MTFQLRYHERGSGTYYYGIDLTDGRSFVVTVSVPSPGEVWWFCLREDHPERDGVTSGYALIPTYKLNGTHTADSEQGWSIPKYEISGHVKGQSIESVLQDLELQLAAKPYEETHPSPPAEMVPHLKTMGSLMQSYIEARQRGSTEESAALEKTMGAELLAFGAKRSSERKYGNDSTDME